MICAYDNGIQVNDNTLFTCEDRQINNQISFDCIPRYFVAEGYLTLSFSGKYKEIGIALKPFLGINTGSIVSIERQKQSLFIRSYYDPKLTIYQIQQLLKDHKDNFSEYPNTSHSTYKENRYNFKLMLTQQD
jgi:hypothetical protein